jgi:hypothetical protein
VATTSPTQAQLAPVEHTTRSSLKAHSLKAQPPDAGLDPYRACGLRLLSLWHLTSLDAPTVAAVWALAFAHAAGIRLPLWVPVMLALCAWSVYIGDRLLDAYRAIRDSHDSDSHNSDSHNSIENRMRDLRPRHYFHWEYRRILLPVSIASAIVAVTLIVYFMPLAARERNSLFAVGALAYFTSVHSPWRFSTRRFRIPKELLVGILFTLACVLPAWARMPANLSGRWALLTPVTIFIALAWLNCAAIENWESGVRWERRFSIFRLAIALCVCAAIAASITAALHEPRIALLLIGAMLAAGLTAVLDRNAMRLAPTTLRALADLVLLAPVLIVVFLP